jgi:glucokinase
MKKVLGIDVGGTKIAAGLVDRNFRVSQVSIMPTSQTDLLGQLERLIMDYNAFDAIGLGMPGQVLHSGEVVKLGNVPWKSLNLKTRLEKKFKIPVSVVNDSKAFALAEAVVGSCKKYDSIAGVILGTGIGVGLISNKKIYFGKDGVAGELEHVVLLDGKMLRDHKRAAGKFNSALAAKKYLKTLLDMIVLSLNPEVIVLGGAWSGLPGMKKLANELATNSGGYQTKTLVKVSKLKHAGIIGAALPLLNN